MGNTGTKDSRGFSMLSIRSTTLVLVLAFALSCPTES